MFRNFVSRAVVGSLLALVCFSVTARAQTSTTPGTATGASTLICIGLEWPITGDSDHDATCTTQYRVSGSGTWLDAQPLMRCDNSDHNGLYGSIFDLTPGTNYEVRLTMTDPDGGGTATTTNVTTRAVPAQPTGGNTYHVIPGSGGGDGSAGNPFRGIAAAEAVAQGGDIFLLHVGDYGVVLLTKAGGTNNPIVWKAAGDGAAIIQGMTVKNWVWLDGLYFLAGSEHIQNKDWLDYGRSNALTVPDGSNASNVFVTGCTFRDFFHTIKCHGGGYWYIADNDIRGIADPITGGAQGEGIEPDNSNSIICYNVIKRTADPISYPAANTDIYGNDIQDASDDGVETDKGRTNVRVFRNRLTNICSNVFTFQSMGWGPWYFIRNQVVLTRGKLWKFVLNVDDRFFVAHNTFIFPEIASEYAQCLLNSVHKNNLYIAYTSSNNLFRARHPSGGDPGLPYETAFWMTDMDYDGFDWDGKPGSPDPIDAPFLWFGVAYYDLAPFAAAVGIEPHGIVVDRTQIFEDWVVPTTTYDQIPKDYVLKSGANVAVDYGAVLANINDGYTGTAPDLGAFERGVSVPHYGPRVFVYTLTVTSGSGSGGYDAGALVEIVADTPPAGQAFGEWTGDVAYVDDVYASTATVTMPAQSIAVTATYLPAFTLTVNSGAGDGAYPAGRPVPISADPAPLGMAFDKWVGDVSSVANVYSADTMVTMPSANIAVTATYTSIIASNDWSYDEFQFKFTMGGATVWLYIPPATTQVRALFLLQQNVVEQMVSVHPYIRQACDASDVAIAWCSPGFDAQFQTDPLASHDLIQTTFSAVGQSIGYPELGTVPLITFGHSSTNGYAQRSAEARPDRVLAVIATHGWDALGGTEYFLNYAGPILSFFGCKWEMNQNTRDVRAPLAIQNISNVTDQLQRYWMPISKVEQYGSGHFDYSDEVVELFAMFIMKAVAARLDGNGNLQDVDPNSGWIAPGMPSAPTAPITIKPYTAGTATEKARSIWFFDQEMAEAAAAFIYGNGPWNRTFQMAWFNTAGGTPAGYASNGVCNPVPYQIVTGTNALQIWPVLLDAIPNGFTYSSGGTVVDYGGTPIGHSSDPTLTVGYDCGPYVYVDDQGTRRIKINRAGPRTGYLVARHLGDATYRPCVQPTYLTLGNLGAETAPITNPGNQNPGVVITLPDNSTGSEYVGYYVDHGPARIVNGYQLEILPLPENTTGQLEVQLYAYRLTQSVPGVSSVTFYVPRDVGAGYVLTVNSGAGDGTYAAGALVDITANVAPQGYVFDKWTGDTEYVDDILEPITTVLMPAQNVTVTATYLAMPTYTLTVNSGTGDGYYIENRVVDIAADTAPLGRMFKEWTGDTGAVTNVNSASTTVTMPAADVTLTAAYEPIPGSYVLWVINGTGTGVYAEEEVVPIAADAAPGGYIFDQWIGDTDTVADVLASNTTVTMPAFDITVEATYVPVYALTVNYGTGDGTYRAGAEVEIAADPPPVGKVFGVWQGDAQYITDPNSATTTVTMPADDIAVTAIFDPIGGPFMLRVTKGHGGGMYPFGAVVPITADAPPVGQQFRRWTGDTAGVANCSLADTTVTIPAADVSVTAYFAFPSQSLFTLTVNSGTGDGDSQEGDVRQIVADTPPGQIFDEWTGDTQYVANVHSSTTNVTMPAANVTVTATFVPSGVDMYTLTVNSGTGDGSYPESTPVAIEADAPPAGKIFYEWTGDTPFVADVLSSSTTVTMPAANVTVTATYVDEVVLHMLTVNSGTGGGDYEEGDVVQIVADAPPAGMEFNGWTGDTAFLAAPNASTTNVTMPDGDVTVTAAYKNSLLQVVFPSSDGITFERGGRAYIAWTAAPGLDRNTPLKIELTNGADTWVLTEKAKAGKSPFKWNVGKWKSKTGQPVYPDGDDYWIRICTLDESVEDSSDNPFAIGIVTALEINGPAEVDENSTAQCTCIAHFNFGAPQDYTNAKLKWYTLSKFVKIKKGGLVQTKSVTLDQLCTIIAGYGKKAYYVEGSHNLTIKNQ
jgi:hypothetical protein